MKHNFVTIDWDYCFPDTGAFDWGHSELKGFFFEFAWSTRPHQHALYGPEQGKRAIDVMHPNPERLASVRSLIEKWDPALIFVAESHEAGYYIPNRLNLHRLCLWNIDAHHDAGYEAPYVEGKPSCENWVQHLRKERRITEYHLIYPEWRKEWHEGQNKKGQLKAQSKVNFVYYEMPCYMEALQPFCLLLVRSPSWSPTWADHEWLGLLDLLKTKRGFNEKRILGDTCTKQRSPNKDEALTMADTLQAQLDEGMRLLEEAKKAELLQRNG